MDVTKKLSQIRPMNEQEQQRLMQELDQQRAQMEAAAKPDAAPDVSENAAPGFVEDDPSTWGNPGRNVLCPCGSGKKFKHCHGRFG